MSIAAHPRELEATALTLKPAFCPPNLRSLDALRGLLACYVVLGHARWLLWAGFSEWNTHSHGMLANAVAYAGGSLRFGHEAVMVFFVLSGFFIHLRMAQSMAAKKPVKLKATDYARRRIHRLLAPYLFALGLTIVCDLLGRMYFPELYRAATGDSLLDANFARKDFSWAAILPACLVVPGAMGKDFGSNGPLWSLAFEVVYYVLYPVWLRARRASPWLAYGLIPVGCACVSLLHGAPWITSVVMHYPVWLAGAAVAEWMTREQADESAGGVAMLGTGLVVAPTVGLWLQFPVMEVIASIFIGVGVVCLFARMPRVWTSHRWHRACEFFGTRSYTIYICHFPLLVLMCAATIQFRGERPLSGWLAAAGALTTLGLCCAAFNVCERHFLHARIRLNEHRLRNLTAIALHQFPLRANRSTRRIARRYR